MINNCLNRLVLAMFLALVLSLAPMGFKWDSAFQFDQNTVEARGGGGAGGGAGGAGGGAGAAGGAGSAGGGPGGGGAASDDGSPGHGYGLGAGLEGTPGKATSEAATNPETTGLDKAIDVVGTTPAGETEAINALEAAQEASEDEDQFGEDRQRNIGQTK